MQVRIFGALSEKKRGFLTLCFLFSIQLQVVAQTEVSAVDTLRERYEGAYDLLLDPLDDLNKKYAEALERLLKKESDAGELESALEVKNELEGFGNGQEFSEQEFLERKATLPSLQRLKKTYIEQRETTFERLQKPLADLTKKYIDALDQLEKEQTRLQNFEVALAAKEEKDRVSQERGQEGASVPLFKGRVLFVAKGEVEIRINGEKLSYSNSSREDGYLSGESRPRDFESGDLLQIEASGTAVYRSLIVILASEDGKQFLPLTHEDFRIGSSDHMKREDTFDVSENLPTGPSQGRPDSMMGSLWAEIPVPDEVRRRSDWIKIESNTGPNFYLAALDGTDTVQSK